MAGGTFDKLAGKVRPGTYINFESTRQDTVGISERGIVLLPLAGHNFGPAGEFITLLASAPDAERLKLGYSVYDEENRLMLLIREAFKNAAKVIVYITASGDKATGAAAPLTVTSRYGGERGNAIRTAEGFEISEYGRIPTAEEINEIFTF